jgi:outer membrane protein assembly factor BamE (lipoprotein component of BamABCDE complex)
MFKYLIIFISIIALNNCKINPVLNHHGVHYLDKKNKKIKIEINNKNDVKKILGPPSSIDKLNNEIWLYLEKKTTVSNLRSLGREKLLVNNVLLLEFNDRGILIKKNFYNKDDMNELSFNKNTTNQIFQNKQLLSNILETLRKKINDPLGQRTIKK